MSSRRGPMSRSPLSLPHRSPPTEPATTPSPHRPQICDTMRQIRDLIRLRRVSALHICRRVALRSSLTPPKRRILPLRCRIFSLICDVPLPTRPRPASLCDVGLLFSDNSPEPHRIGPPFCPVGATICAVAAPLCDDRAGRRPVEALPRAAAPQLRDISVAVETLEAVHRRRERRRCDEKPELCDPRVLS
jgi:hypothetical protein